jgi:hypothetical protein
MQNDHDYYFVRAKTEREMADRAQCREAARVHHLMATYYIDRLAKAGLRDSGQ